MRTLVATAGALSFIACSADNQRNIGVAPTAPTLYVVVAEAEDAAPVIESLVLDAGARQTLNVKADFGTSDVTAHLIEVPEPAVESIQVSVLGQTRALLDVVPLEAGTFEGAPGPSQTTIEDGAVRLAVPNGASVRQIYPTEAPADVAFVERATLRFDTQRQCPQVELEPVGRTRVMFEGIEESVWEVRTIDSDRLLLVTKRRLLIGRRSETVALADLSRQERGAIELDFGAISSRPLITGVVEDPRPQPQGQKRYIALLNRLSRFSCDSNQVTPGRVGLFHVTVDEDGFTTTATATAAYVELDQSSCMSRLRLDGNTLHMLSSSDGLRSYELDGNLLATRIIDDFVALKAQQLQVYEDPETRFVVTSRGAFHVFNETRELWTTHAALPDQTASPQDVPQVAADRDREGSPIFWLVGDNGGLYFWSERLTDGIWVPLKGQDEIIEACLVSDAGLADLVDIRVVGDTMLLAISDCSAVMLVDIPSGRICHATERGADLNGASAPIHGSIRFSVVDDEVFVSASGTRILSAPRAAFGASE